ncbi:thioredoxin family protein [Candidatus Solincola tengchongensis]|uniref:thioredoxin family protein n=1 Tax=Candidatus Solincola tengchongensis TaxID=2900693 RepID=UPI00257AE1A4|nr:thioredoxin family protein [Candidatus Solincola tengchongensis]
MEIKVLGPGCKKCIATKEAIKEVVSELGLDAVVEEVTDMAEIMKYNVLTTPGVVIDGKVVSKGKIPSKKEIESWLKP